MTKAIATLTQSDLALLLTGKPLTIRLRDTELEIRLSSRPHDPLSPLFDDLGTWARDLGFRPGRKSR